MSLMKLWNHTILALAGITTVLVSCQKQYEPVPVEQTTLAYAFNTQDSAGVMALDYLSGCYLETFMNGHNRIGNIDYLDAASDDAISA